VLRGRAGVAPAGFTASAAASVAASATATASAASAALGAFFVVACGLAVPHDTHHRAGRLLLHRLHPLELRRNRRLIGRVAARATRYTRCSAAVRSSAGRVVGRPRTSESARLILPASCSPSSTSLARRHGADLPPRLRRKPAVLCWPAAPVLCWPAVLASNAPVPPAMPPGALTGLSVAWFARPTGAVPQGVPLVLKKLDLDSCSGLTALPAELGALTGLQKPNLSYCKGLTAGWRSSGRSRACRSWICPTAKG